MQSGTLVCPACIIGASVPLPGNIKSSHKAIDDQADDARIILIQQVHHTSMHQANGGSKGSAAADYLAPANGAGLAT